MSQKLLIPARERKWQVSSAATLKEWQGQCLSGVSVTLRPPPGCWIQFGECNIDRECKVCTLYWGMGSLLSWQLP